MSGERRRARRPTPAARGPVRVGPLALGALVGAAGGGLLADRAAPHLAAPSPVPVDRWQVVSPGLEASIYTPGVGRGTHVVDGALTIARHAFYRTENVSALTAAPVTRAELQLAPDSDAVAVVIGDSDTGGDSPQFVVLHPERYKANLATSDWTPARGGHYTFAWADGALTLDPGTGPVEVGRGSPGRFELGAVDGLSRVRAVRLSGPDGATLLEDDFSRATLPRAYLAAGAALGALAGLGLAWVALGGGTLAGGLLGALLLALPPLVVLETPFTAWLSLVEKLYMVRLPAWALARWALLASLLPLLAAMVLRSGVLRLPDRAGVDRLGMVAWPLGTGLALAAASRQLDGPRADALLPLALVVGLPLALLPLRVGLATHLGPWLRRDLPALVLLATLGWAPGLLAATLWRLLALLAAVPVLLRRAPRAAVDTLLLLLLALAPAAELAVRGSWLGAAWSPEKLSLELTTDAGERSRGAAAWSDRCGAGATPHGLVVDGGSSTGGAYQFADEPGAFFTAQAHQRLCAGLDPATSLTTWNFGDGGRDTWVIAQNVEAVLDRTEADVLVLYVGVNDLLTQHHTLTRKQREVIKAERGAAARGLAGLAARSRLVTAAGLLAREVDIDAPKVSDVPLPDAEDNLRAIAAAADARGARVLLLTEYVVPAQAFLMAPYAAMQRRLADELPNVRYADVYAHLDPYAAEGLLADRNHLNRRGNALLGELVAREVAAMW